MCNFSVVPADHLCLLWGIILIFPFAKPPLEDVFWVACPRSGPPCSPPNLSAAEEIDKRSEVLKSRGWMAGWLQHRILLPLNLFQLQHENHSRGGRGLQYLSELFFFAEKPSTCLFCTLSIENWSKSLTHLPSNLTNSLELQKCLRKAVL